MSELTERLRARRGEIEAATLARAQAISDPAAVEDPGYALGLRKAVATGLDHAISALESSDAATEEVPDHLLGQARAAARHGVSLDTVLCRYSAGHTLLGDHVIEAAQEAALSSEELKSALRAQADVYDRMVRTVSQEYTRELESRQRRHGRRLEDLVRRLLAGDPVDMRGLQYPLDAWHVGVVAAGPGAPEFLRELATELDRRLLLAAVEQGTVWAWFAGRRKPSVPEVLAVAQQSLADEIVLAVGEAGGGAEGWRLTHRQAKVALPVALRGRERLVRYADVALLAAALRDDLLADSLRSTYLAPLESERDGGAALRETLRAYFTAGRNVSSAAAALGVNRQTVSIRLRTAEEKTGRSLSSGAAEVEVALQLGELDDVRDPSG